jgi:hypothetical protein
MASELTFQERFNVAQNRVIEAFQFFVELENGILKYAAGRKLPYKKEQKFCSALMDIRIVMAHCEDIIDMNTKIPKQ